MKRSFKIEKFRNLAIDNDAELVINTSLNKGETGDLITIIGENNKGKSNVLSALRAFGNKAIQERDRTNLENDPRYRKPTLSFVTGKKDDYSTITLEYGKSNYVTDLELQEISSFDRKLAKDILKQMVNYGADFNKQLDIVEKTDSTKEELCSAYKDLVDYLKALPENYNQNYYNRNHYNFMYNWMNQNHSELMKKMGESPLDLFSKTYLEKYNLNAIPNIVEYSEKMISASELNCNPEQINSFISVVLSDIGINREEITTTYRLVKEQNTHGFLEKLEKKLNKKLEVVAKKFNKIFLLKDGAYSFKFRAEETKLCLTIFRDSEPLNLDFQSTGFKWFFNVYFNRLAKNELKPGDILIMDEPANNLHPKGICELRKFLKDYALKSGITIVVATNSPFMIDMDNLDEIRLIRNVDGKSTIINDFTTFNPDNTDTLAAVCDDLTIKPHVLAEPDKHLIFVEGITDYNYLTAFKNMLGSKYDNLSFVPIGGLGDPQSDDFKEQQKNKLKDLNRIGKRKDPILLVDGDGAGLAIKELNKDNKDLRILSLEEVDPKFKEIEYLFTESDRKKQGITDKNGDFVKCSGLSSNIKKYRKEKDFTDETKGNFTKLFDYLLEINE